MAQWLKNGQAMSVSADAAADVRRTVEGLLADIEARGNAAVRELSIRFDKWDRKDYRLTDQEIRACLVKLSARDLEDMRFAQA